MRRRRSTTIPLALASALLAVGGLAACGADDDAAPTAGRAATTTTTEPATTTTAAAPSTTATAPTTTTTAPSTTTIPASTATTPTPTSTSASTPTTTTAAPPPPVDRAADDRVFVLGDSALLGARETVPAALPGWHVTFDAVGSRRLPQGIEVLRARRAEIGEVVVIQMGNNFIAAEGSFADQIDRAMTVLAGVDRVVWLTVAEKWPSRVAINQAIRATPQRWPQAVVADWAQVIAEHPEYAGDMLHLSAAGRVAIARLIADHVGPP